MSVRGNIRRGAVRRGIVRRGIVRRGNVCRGNVRSTNSTRLFLQIQGFQGISTPYFQGFLGF